MEFEIEEVEEVKEVKEVKEVESLGKVDIQIFKIEELHKCLDYLKQTCILPFIKKSDFDTIEKLMICYRTILVSFETLKIGQEVISSLNK